MGFTNSELYKMWERYVQRVKDTNDQLGEIVEEPMSYEDFCYGYYEANREH